MKNWGKYKKITYLLVLVFCAALVSGCGKGGEGLPDRTAEKGDYQESGKKGRIVCTIFPIYDWTREILGEGIEDYEVTVLMKNGSDLHNFQPSVMDMARIADCDLFLYIGGESDAWAKEALKEKRNVSRRELALLEVLGENTLEEEEVSTAIDYEREKSERHGNAKEGAPEEEEADEHVWLSLKNAQIMVKEIESALEVLEKSGDMSAGTEENGNGDILRENTEKYLKRLEKLDAEYEKAVREANKNTLLFCDRFPFRYLTEDYGLRYYAAFSGCSADTQASFETIAYLSAKVDELGLDAVLVLENSDEKVARVVVRNTMDKNQKILVLHSMQSVGWEETEEGLSYLTLMEENLETLRTALQ